MFDKRFNLITSLASREFMTVTSVELPHVVAKQRIEFTVALYANKSSHRSRTPLLNEQNGIADGGSDINEVDCGRLVVWAT